MRITPPNTYSKVRRRASSSSSTRTGFLNPCSAPQHPRHFVVVLAAVLAGHREDDGGGIDGGVLAKVRSHRSSSNSFSMIAVRDLRPLFVGTRARSWNATNTF